MSTATTDEHRIPLPVSSSSSLGVATHDAQRTHTPATVASHYALSEDDIDTIVVETIACPSSTGTPRSSSSTSSDGGARHSSSSSGRDSDDDAAAMYVLKRDGTQQPVHFDKITRRVARMARMAPALDATHVDASLVAQKVVSGVYPGVTTVELDELAAETAAAMATTHPDYARLAARIAVSNLHKQTRASFADTVHALHANVHAASGERAPLVSDELVAAVRAHGARIDAQIDYARDFRFDYFAYKTLERSYLQSVQEDGRTRIVERPQHMYMRVALGIHGAGSDAALAAAFETYDLLSRGVFTHATPTLFNAGTAMPQMSSCYLLAMRDDSIDGIYDTLKQCALISKTAGGIGLSVHNVRASRSYIRGTNGLSNGIVPMLRVFNDTARYVNQGGNKRKGAFAVYLEPWHADVYDFLDLKKNTGKDERRARDLFYGLWVPDLFMERVRDDAQWSLFCPNEAPGLHECCGDAFRTLYERYEHEGRARRTVRAHELWNKIIESQIETGTPYMLYKDAANLRSNQQHLGTIKSSNLCCVAADQRVPTDKGMLTVGELYEDGTPSRVVGRERHERASKMYLPRPNAPMVKIVTREGYTHKVTPDHKVWVVDEGWREAQQLREGDRLAVQCIEGLWGDGAYEDEAFLAGYETGLAAWPHEVPRAEGACRLLSADDEGTVWSIGQVRARVRAKYDDLFPASNPFNHHKLCALLAPRDALLDLSGAERFYKNSEPIHVPDFVWRGTRRTVHRYLSGLYSAAGTSVERHARGGMVYTLHSRLRELVDHVQLLWANFGRFSWQHPGTVTSAGAGGAAVDVSASHFGLSLIIPWQQADSSWTSFFFGGDAAPPPPQQQHATFERLETLPNEDAYCVVVDSDEHSWVANGVVTKNTEIIEYTAPDEVAVCNLASLALPRFLREARANERVDTLTSAAGVATGTPALVFDHAALHDVAKVVTRNLNKIIDRNYYPVAEARNSNVRHRPIGIGVQGLADVFVCLRMPYDSHEAQQLNREVFETIYHAALDASCELAQRDGTYPTYAGSPADAGRLQFDLWGVKPESARAESPAHGRWDWPALRARIAAHGLRNSLLVAPMPTASTAQILGNNESVEPFTSNVYARRVLAGEFAVVNRHLHADLQRLGLWTDDVRREIIARGGSVQGVPGVPADVQRLYRTVWELKQRTILSMAADRGAYVCQSQSLNVHMAAPTVAKVSAMHFYGWRRGLKTGMYYLRTRPAADAIQFTVDQQALQRARATAGAAGAAGDAAASERDERDGASSGGGTSGAVCRRAAGDNGEPCLMCSS